MNPPVSIAVLDGPVQRQTTALLAERLNLPIVPSNSTALAHELLLMVRTNGQLGIAQAEEFRSSVELHPEHPAWYTPDFARRFRASGRDPLMRAVGYTTRTLIDCTAGWCVDAAHFAYHGIRVATVENHPVVAAILESAFAGPMPEKIAANLTLHHQESRDFLASVRQDPDVIYIDPMYPAKPGTAAVKRPLQILQVLHSATATDDGAARVLLYQARRRATRRIVVKRPHFAEPLADGASGAITAKLVRFDLYPPL